MTSYCKGCRRRLTLESFFLQHENRQDFLLARWSSSPYVYAAWSSFCSVYTLSMVIYSGVISEAGVRIVIWLTYWCFYCLALRFLVTACNSWFHILTEETLGTNRSSGHRSGTFLHRSEQTLPTNLSCQWLLQNFSNASSLIVTGLFWTIIYTGGSHGYATFNSHAVNSLLVVADVMISRAPVRLQHIHIPNTFLAFYIVFTIIYWAGGGRNQKGEPFIYSVLDYSNKPKTATIVILGAALVAVPIAQALLYCLVLLRTNLFEKLNKNGDKKEEASKMKEKKLQNEKEATGPDFKITVTQL